jgi:hypothetical protein
MIARHFQKKRSFVPLGSDAKREQVEMLVAPAAAKLVHSFFYGKKHVYYTARIAVPTGSESPIVEKYRRFDANVVDLFDPKCMDDRFSTMVDVDVLQGVEHLPERIPSGILSPRELEARRDSKELKKSACYSALPAQQLRNTEGTTPVVGYGSFDHHLAPMEQEMAEDTEFIEDACSPDLDQTGAHDI